jgi:hypothetical protein
MFLIFFISESIAQTEHNYILNTNLGYNYAFVDKVDEMTYDMYNMMLSEREINDLNLSVSMGRKLRSNFYYGLGFTLNLRKDELNPGVNKPHYESEMGVYLSSYNAVSQTSIYGPMAYFQYYFNLSERSFFTLTLISQYDFEKNVSEHRVFTPGIMPGNEYFTINVYSSKSKRQYFKTGLVPGFRMNIYRSFGVDITMGSMAYRIKTTESRLPDIKKSREFAIGFKPENWTIGFHLAF